MKLKKLFKDIEAYQIKGSKEIEITGVCINSKVVAPGNLFIAKKGRTEDGALYIHEAIDGGAAAILTDIFDPSLKHVTQIIHPDVASLEGKIAAEYYQHPSEELLTVGITGTNGKTTTSFLIKHLLDGLGLPCGLIGTIEYIIGLHRYQATRTTPDACSNQKMLKEMLLQGCQAAVMEVSSHALDQGRADQIDFDIAIFTNLTLEHLDYHGSLEEYCAAKSKLFTSMKKHKKKKHATTKTVIVNADSPWTDAILSKCSIPPLTYGLTCDAGLKATNIELSANGSTFTLEYNKQVFACQSPFIGRHNIYNWLAAAAVGLTHKADIATINALLKSAPSVPGRLESVPNHLGVHIYVDFAHTDDALENVLKCLKELEPRQLITVFGCGGDRDRAKRPKMAKVSEEYSDFTIITSDNPRTENPLAICTEITQGFSKSANYMVEIDRKLAIEKAIDCAQEGDIILIAGKGHEPYQIFAHKTIEFDDRKVAAQICEKRELGCGA